jgi:hypothetical protein
MTRLAVALFIFLCLLPPASATLAPRREPTTFAKDLPAAHNQQPSQGPVQAAATGGQDGEFAITDETEVLLNGRACRYRDVPGNAHIVNMEVAPDRKTVLKVHFRTGR